MKKEPVLLPVGINEEAYKKLLPVFLNEIREEFQMLEEKFLLLERKAVKQIAHKIKGASVSYGANKVAREAFAIELGAINESENTTRKRMDRLKDCITEVISHAEDHYHVIIDSS